METNAQMKIVEKLTDEDVYTVQGSPYPYATLVIARSAAAFLAMKLRHGIKIFKNGVECSYKRY